MTEKPKDTIDRENIEKAVVFITEKFKDAQGLTKPVLFHSLHAGLYLYDRGYPLEIVLAGLLHDILEDTETTREEVAQNFGEEVCKLVVANTKDDTIADKHERKKKMIENCITAGEPALIVKAADVLENYTYHPGILWQAGVDYLNEVSKIILSTKPDTFNNKIFSELQHRHDLNRNDQL